MHDEIKKLRERVAFEENRIVLLCQQHERELMLAKEDLADAREQRMVDVNRLEADARKSEAYAKRVEAERDAMRAERDAAQRQVEELKAEMWHLKRGVQRNAVDTVVLARLVERAAAFDLGSEQGRRALQDLAAEELRRANLVFDLQEDR